MDNRPEPGLVKWSSHTTVDSFIHINLQHRVVQLYEPTGHACRGRFDYTKLSRHEDFPPLTTYEWSQANPDLLAVGTGSGIVNLLRIDDGSNAYLELGLKMARTCQAVSFNSTGLLAVGLDRVRADSSLHVWDLSTLSSLDKSTTGLPKNAAGTAEPKYRLEPSVSVSSIKFFEDSPQTLVAGIKAQGLRIHDLRDPSNVTTFQTKCNNNLAIDYADQNYFASSALDQPGVMIWDRRVTSKAVTSHSYLQAIEGGDIPWGGVLKLDKVIDTDFDPQLAEGKHSLIRSLRFSRDRRGLLAVLSRTGQLKVLETNKESSATDTHSPTGPELLHVSKSHEMFVSYKEAVRKNDRIVSFDWITLPSPSLRPRLFVLRANGSFDILEQPTNTLDHIYKLVPWQTPYRGLEETSPYHSIMQFEETQAPQMLGPFVAEQLMSEVTIFGGKKHDLRAVTAEAKNAMMHSSTLLGSVHGIETPLPPSFDRAVTVAGKLKALRQFIREEVHGRSVTPQDNQGDSNQPPALDLSLASHSSKSCREMHEDLLTTLISCPGLPPRAQAVVDHTMTLRAKEGYLFDTEKNRTIVCDDPWTRFVWDWIADAEQAADDSGMIASDIDMSYLGVHSIWINDLGRQPRARLSADIALPDNAKWERALIQYCKKRKLPKFDGSPTKRVYHRQFCLEICTWGDPQRRDSGDASYLDYELGQESTTTTHTMMAAKALFRGDTKQAIEILNKASATHPELQFVSLALQLTGRNGKQFSRERLDFDDSITSTTDPYLRAMSTLIATGDWTAVANQRSLPLSDRAYVAVRNFSDDQLSVWLRQRVAVAVDEGDIEGIVLTGISDRAVDIFARYVQKFHDVQTATLILSICYPRYIDDIRCRAWRNAYRAHLQRHKLFFQRTKFEVESTKRSKRDGVPTLKPPSRQIALRCVFCDAETSLANHHATPAQASTSLENRNPLLATSINAGVSCPNCGRHLPRCVVCLEVVGIPRSDRPEEKEEMRTAGRFPTFCLKCEHVLHLDHARQWFSRHIECPVPECRCRCNSRANPELNYH